MLPRIRRHVSSDTAIFHYPRYLLANASGESWKVPAAIVRLNNAQ